VVEGRKRLDCLPLRLAAQAIDKTERIFRIDHGRIDHGGDAKRSRPESLKERLQFVFN
jgi:hypothetical protein